MCPEGRAILRAVLAATTSAVVMLSPADTLALLDAADALDALLADRTVADLAHAPAIAPEPGADHPETFRHTPGEPRA